MALRGDGDGEREGSVLKGGRLVFGEGYTGGATPPPPNPPPPNPPEGDDDLERRSSCGGLEHVKKRLWGSMFEGVHME